LRIYIWNVIESIGHLFGSDTWNAIGAMGQWVGAIATSIAVWITLQQNKPNIKILLREVDPFYPSLSNFSLKITIVNKKAIPITLKEASFMTWNGKRVVSYNYFGNRLPKTLNTSDDIEFEISDNELSSRLKSEGYKGKICMKLFVMDSTYKFHNKWFLFDIDKKTIKFIDIF